MGLFNDVKAFAKLDIDARKVLASYRLLKLAGEVELGDGFQAVDIEADAAEVEFEPEHGEDKALRAKADDILEAGSVPCWEAGYTLADAAEMAAEREEANEGGWIEGRYLIA